MPSWSEPKWPEDTPEQRYVENVAVTRLMVSAGLSHEDALKRVREQRRQQRRNVWRDRMTREWWQK
jgi:hypothetical protein